MKALFTILIMSFALSLLSQNPELIVDYNSGPDDSFNKWNYTGIVFNDGIILPVVSNLIGEELGIIKDGQLSILKDINPGPEGSNPKSFFIYNDFLYFATEKGTDGAAIWRTDGTESGTTQFFANTNNSSTPRSFIKADNGWLYYNIDNIIYRTDGNVNEEIYSGASLEYINKHASPNHCKYKNGIAFITKNDDYSFTLINIDDTEAIELAKTESTSFFADAFGLAPLSAGLMFSIYESDNHDAVYIYDDASKLLRQLPIQGELIPSRRTIDFGAELNICWISGKGYFSVNGVEGEEELLVSSGNSSATQGRAFIHAIYDDKLVFVPISGGWLWDDFLVHTDGSEGGTSQIKNIDNPHLSEMVTFKNYAFLVEGISNNFKPNMIQINLETGTAEDFYTFEESSKQINSVRPLGILEGYLYFISNLNEQVGFELYRIKTNLSVSTEETENFETLFLTQKGNEFSIEIDSNQNIYIRIYNSLGQLVYHDRVNSNQVFSPNLSTGAYFLNYSIEGKSETKTIFINQ